MTTIYQCPQIDMYKDDPPLVKMMILVYKKMIDLGNLWLRFEPYYNHWLWVQSHSALALTDGSEYINIKKVSLATESTSANIIEAQQQQSWYSTISSSKKK